MLEYKGINWYKYHGALLPRIKPDCNISLSKKEQKELLKLSKAYFIRWCDEWDRDGGEFWYVIKDQKEDLASYKSKVRNQIRKGLKHCRVERVSKEYIAKNAYAVYRKAFKRYDTFIDMGTAEQFKNNFNRQDNRDYWAVFVGERLVAYAENILWKNACEYSSVKLDPDYLKLYPAYALFFTMNLYYLNEKNLRYVSDGARSLSHDTKIQEFLIKKFYFRKAFCRLNVTYRKDIQRIVSLFYPFRHFITKSNYSPFQKLSVLLRHEEIRRSYE